MSESPFPYDHVTYQSTQPQGGAPTLVKVAAILNLVMAGLEILYGVMFVVFAVLIGTGTIPQSTLADAMGPPGAATPPLPPISVIVLIITVMGVLSFMTAILKIISGVKLLRRGRGAWGCGLASGIVGCVQPWCAYFCLLPLAIGIFTIVVMCLENTRRYFATPLPTPGI